MHSDEAHGAALLDWYRAMGADEAISDTPASWWQSRAAPAPIAVSPAVDTIRETHPRPAAPQRDRTGLAIEAITARELAQQAATLDGLRCLAEAFDGCDLKKTAKKFCFARGPAAARVMLIGEAPGKDEDDHGIPFAGRPGQLLDRMLRAIGLDESDVYLTNLVFWRPLGNLAPSAEEMLACLPFVERQIELVSPQILVFLGNAAAKQLTDATEGILKLRGKWLSYSIAGEGRQVRAMATLHPAYLLKHSIAKRLAWRDFMAIREALDAHGTTAAN